jgi:hypothetical protein
VLLKEVKSSILLFLEPGSNQSVSTLSGTDNPVIYRVFIKSLLGVLEGIQYQEKIKLSHL